jgi:hypothetical protein
MGPAGGLHDRYRLAVGLVDPVEAGIGGRCSGSGRRAGRRRSNDGTTIFWLAAAAVIGATASACAASSSSRRVEALRFDPPGDPHPAAVRKLDLDHQTLAFVPAYKAAGASGTIGWCGSQLHGNSEAHAVIARPSTARQAIRPR